MTTRNSDPKPRSGGSKWGQVGKARNTDPISWSSCDARVLQAAVAAVTEDGAALLFSKTSDGGALALQILDGTSKYKHYLADSVALDDLLRELSNS